MDRENERAGLGQHQDVGRHLDALRLDSLDLSLQCPGIEDHAVADNRRRAGDDARRQQGKLIDLTVDDQCVPGVVPALKAHDHVRPAREPVDDLALALVAPLRTDDRYVAQVESPMFETPALLGAERSSVQLRRTPLERVRVGSVRPAEDVRMKPMTEQHLRSSVATWSRSSRCISIWPVRRSCRNTDPSFAAPDGCAAPSVRSQSLMLMAYQDTPLPIGFDKTISQPFIGALMLALLDLEPSARVLEVGTGFGYQAAVMADMGAEVFRSRSWRSSPRRRRRGRPPRL